MNGTQVLRKVPPSWVARAQRAAEGNTRTSRLLKQISRRLVSGRPQAIAAGPAKGLLIDVGDSRPSYLLGNTEPEVQAFLADHLAVDGCLYDLGANVGFFTLVGAALVGPSGHVRAYEPLPSNAATLRANVDRNTLSQVTVVDAAVSDEDGVATLKMGPTSQDATLGEGDLMVRTVRIDSEIAHGAPPPTLIKIDVEGGELRALHGMRDTLATYRPTIVCEMHRSASLTGPVPQFLADLGYRVDWLEDDVGPGYWAPHLIAVPSG